MIYTRTRVLWATYGSQSLRVRCFLYWHHLKQWVLKKPHPTLLTYPRYSGMWVMRIKYREV